MASVPCRAHVDGNQEACPHSPPTWVLCGWEVWLAPEDKGSSAPQHGVALGFRVVETLRLSNWCAVCHALCFRPGCRTQDLDRGRETHPAQ